MKKKKQEVNAVKVMQTLVELWMDQMNVTGTVEIIKKNKEVDDEFESVVINIPC